MGAHKRRLQSVIIKIKEDKMKKILSTLLFILIATLSYAQTSKVTLTVIAGKNNLVVDTELF